jgi:hypothetical protein
MTNKNKELGPNAQSFSDHICAGLDAGGLDSDDYAMSIITNRETGEMGFLMAQVPLSEMPQERTLEASEPIVCYEDRIEWPMEKDAALVLDINDEHPASMCAVAFLSAMLTGRYMPAQKCEECEE